ncbi:MAG: alpha-L-fucosidase [Planctomycetota bacterium]|nr:alpha-L-fucosidase [Planctomycetota bacterium]
MSESTTLTSEERRRFDPPSAPPAPETLSGDELASKLKNNVAFKRREGATDDGLKLSRADMAWWSDAKFGMFIHWGLYAIPGEGEWHMHFGGMSHADYAKLADEFVPKRFDANAWAAAALGAGMKYTVLTARHHDGFALWDSPASHGNYCSTRTAAKRDFVAEYTRACRAAGLRTGLYYSPMDWRFPGYFKPRELRENALRMKRQCYGQVEELMRNYGAIDILWYDGAWLAHQGTDADAAWLWEPLKLNAMVRAYQPKALISPRSGWEGDFGTDEGGHAAAGPMLDWPWEKCLNLNQTSWGYTPEQKLMTRDEVVRMLVNVVGRGGNVLLNVGPDRDGEIPPAHVERLREVGVWLERFGASIFGTRAGPFQPVDGKYCATRRGRRVYVHVLGWEDSETLELPALAPRVSACSLLGGEALAYEQSEQALRIRVPMGARQTPCTVLELETDREA